MALTSYKKFLVERFLSGEKEITIDQYCKNSYKSTIKAGDFKEWLDDYSKRYPRKVQKLKKLKLFVLKLRKS